MGRRPQGGPRASSRAQGPGQVPRLAPRQGMKRRRRGQRGKGEDSDAYKCKKYGKNDQILTCILETNRPRDSRVVSFDFKSNFMLEYVFLKKFWRLERAREILQCLKISKVTKIEEK